MALMMFMVWLPFTCGHPEGFWGGDGGVWQTPQNPQGTPSLPAPRDRRWCAPGKTHCAFCGALLSADGEAAGYDELQWERGGSDGSEGTPNLPRGGTNRAQGTPPALVFQLPGPRERQVHHSRGASLLMGVPLAGIPPWRDSLPWGQQSLVGFSSWWASQPTRHPFLVGIPSRPPGTHRHAAQEGDLSDDEDRGVDVGERGQDDPEADVQESRHDLDGLEERERWEWGQLNPPPAHPQSHPGDGGDALIPAPLQRQHPLRDRQESPGNGLRGDFPRVSPADSPP